METQIGIQTLKVGPIGDSLIYEFNFNLEDSKLSIIIGPNGVGKSLILKLIHDYINKQIKESSMYPREYYIEGYAKRAILIAPLENQYGLKIHYTENSDIYVDDLSVGVTIAELYNKMFELTDTVCSCVPHTIKHAKHLNKSDTIIYKLVFQQHSHYRYFSKFKNKWQLSVGEKVWLAIQYAALTAQSDEIILLDSPETGMHIELQEHIIDNLLETTKCAQIIIGTHSPTIVNTHFDSYATRAVGYIAEEKINDPIDWGNKDN